ncbi:MAG: hypothetical protein RSF34_15795 [Flavobacterium sp.]
MNVKSEEIEDFLVLTTVIQKPVKHQQTYEDRDGYSIVGLTVSTARK